MSMVPVYSVSVHAARADPGFGVGWGQVERRRRKNIGAMGVGKERVYPLPSPVLLEKPLNIYK